MAQEGMEMTRLQELMKVVGGRQRLAAVIGVTPNYITNMTRPGKEWREVLPIKYNGKVMDWAAANYKNVDKLLVCCKACGKPWEGE